MFLPNLDLNKIEEFKNFSINDILDKEYVLPDKIEIDSKDDENFYTITILNGQIKNSSDEYINIGVYSPKKTESFNPFLKLNNDDTEIKEIEFIKSVSLPIMIKNITTKDSCYIKTDIVFKATNDLKLDIVELNISDSKNILVNNIRRFSIKNSQIKYYRIDEIENSDSIITSYVGNIDNGKLDFIGYSSNGMLNLNIWDINLVSINATCNIDGIININNSSRVGSICKINHLAKETSSSQEFRHILNGNSYAMYDGDSTVVNCAKDSVTSQRSKSIMLSDNARILNKPRLNVFTGEVKATHGATVGKLNQEDVFYLKQRGFKDEKINEILVNAFVVDIFDSIQQEEIRRLFYDKR